MESVPTLASTPPLSQEYLYADRGWKLTVFAAVMIPVILIFVGLRFLCRWLKQTPLWVDDWLVLWSLFLSITYSALALCYVKYGGVGRHQAALEILEPNTVTTYWKFLLAISFGYFFIVCWPKLAILALFYRLFGGPGNSPVYRHIILGLAASLIATMIATCIATLTLCHPFAANWEVNIPDSYCLNKQVMFRYGSLPNIITDVVMLILPMPVVWRLNTNKKNKSALTIVFLTGSVGLAFSIARFASFFGTTATIDGTWNSVELMYWTIVEPDVYLIAACLPTYRPLYQPFYEKAVGIISALGCRRVGKNDTHVTPGAGFFNLGHRSQGRKGRTRRRRSWDTVSTLDLTMDMNTVDLTGRGDCNQTVIYSGGDADSSVDGASTKGDELGVDETGPHSNQRHDQRHHFRRPVQGIRVDNEIFIMSERRSGERHSNEV